ncbi:MAG TPA: extracellular solute-binding protein [Phycisphaerae bacterium]|nr:extracellular solute-binding protein [Phycisphaerae bacterium]HRY70294.1 extracellular solute-binding protein [Phycisphaerae bacterium]HSA27535.1 extracellular solute-binding protein [Phycisphaerae bacterium]
MVSNRSRTRGCPAAWVIAVLCPMSILACCCDSKPDKPQLRVFVADSLFRPFNALGKAFEKTHPVELVQIPSGSVLAARKIRENSDQADVLAVADCFVIDKLLRPQFADWYVCFATNEIGIVYTDASKGAAELTTSKWWEILGREGVRVAAANPYHDPCGYWTELCWKLADRHYPPEQGGGRIADRMRTQCGEGADRRSDSEQLLQLVEAAGGVDYAFVYRSQALQHNLAFHRLPPEINLGDVSRVDLYHQVEIEWPARAGSTGFKKQGDLICYAITVPRNARRPDLGIAYIEFLLTAEGRSLIAAQHLNALDHPWTSDPDRVPGSIRSSVIALDTPAAIVPATTSAPGEHHAR